MENCLLSPPLHYIHDMQYSPQIPPGKFQKTLSLTELCCSLVAMISWPPGLNPVDSLSLKCKCIKLRRIGLPCIAWRGLQWCGNVVEMCVDAVVWWRCLVVWRCSGGGVVWQWLWRCSRFCWISLSRSRALLLLIWGFALHFIFAEQLLGDLHWTGVGIMPKKK